VGAGGIFLPGLVVSATNASTSLSFGQSASAPGIKSSGPWTPPQFAKPALTMLTVPATVGNANTGQAANPQTNYVFGNPNVLRAMHRRSAHKTQHPVLTGANISDHVYIMPARVTLEILASDAMSVLTNNSWTGFSTLSVSVWQTFKQLMLNRTGLTLTTRLDTYYNMVILDMDAPDDVKTLHGLRATITLEEIVAGSVASVAANSSRSQATGSTSTGIVQGAPVSGTQQQQNVLPSSLYPNAPTYPTVPGAGSVSSVPLSRTPQ
jgi:hypothetical protein